MPKPASRPLAAFLFAVPIATLGGLIGLGGAKFRLPVLMGVLGYAAKQAVPINLAVSLITLTTSAAARAPHLPFAELLPFREAIGGMAVGGVLAALYGAGLADRLSDRVLHRVVVILLAGIGSLLIVEAFMPHTLSPLIPPNPALFAVLGFCVGLVIGLVSSLLGVAGGELIIPTLIFAFGLDIKLAGSASVLISLPIVGVGVARYYAIGAYRTRQEWTRTILPMGAGSILGAILGGSLVGVVSESALKLALGAILIVSALRIRHT